METQSACVRACQNLAVKFRCVWRISKQKESQHRIRHLGQEIIQRADGGTCRASEHYVRTHTTCNSPKFYEPSTLWMWWSYQRTLTKNIKDSLITTNPGRRDAMTSVHKLAVVLKLAWRQRDAKERTCSLLQDQMINHTNDNWQGCGRKWSLRNKYPNDAEDMTAAARYSSAGTCEGLSMYAGPKPNPASRN